MEREQETRIEQMSLTHGRLLVRDGYTDRRVRVTTPTLAHFHITEDGTVLEAGHDWTGEAVGLATM